MKLKLTLLLSVVFMILGAYSALGVFADTHYDEDTSGDLSGDRLNPTTLNFNAGINIVTATSIAGDVEYVTVTVPEGLQLDMITLESYTSTDNLAFIAVQTGTTFTEDTTGTDVSNLLGYTHFGPGSGHVGTNILDDMASGFGAMGFTPPLTSGSYTFWIQQTGSATTTYALNFELSPITTTATYDENTNGDLSDDRMAPTSVTLLEGGNMVTATSVSGDVEYLTFTVPMSTELDAIILETFNSIDDRSFIAIQSGTTFTEPPAGTTVANLLGYAHFGKGLGQVGTDILDDMGAGAGAMGFTPPLSEGDYTLWIQEVGSNPAGYRLNFVVSKANSTIYLPIVINP